MIEPKYRLFAREMMKYNWAGVPVSLELFTEIQTRFGIVSEGDKLEAAMELKEMARAQVVRYVEQNNLGVLGAGLVLKHDVKINMIEAADRINKKFRG